MYQIMKEYLLVIPDQTNLVYNIRILALAWRRPRNTCLIIESTASICVEVLQTHRSVETLDKHYASNTY